MIIFLSKLVPPAYDLAEVADRRAKLEVMLDEHRINAGHFVESCSFAHGAGIASKSDGIYIAWATLAGGRPYLPPSALNTLKAALTNADRRIVSLAVSSPRFRRAS